MNKNNLIGIELKTSNCDENSKTQKKTLNYSKFNNSNCDETQKLKW